MAKRTKPKRFRLSFVGPIEDQPRLIRAYGKACEGEFALVMRPSEARCVLVLVTKNDGAFMWRSSGEGSDAPQRPETPITEADAVKLIKDEQKAVPKAGPTTLRGRWTGTMTCDGGAPRVELRRKLATYGTLTVTSDPTTGWAWSFERAEKWFGEEGVTNGEGLDTLSAAIEAGVLGAMALVREACSFRDTRRRAAHDPTYAAKHPIKPPKPMKNPTDRLKVRDGGRKRARKAPPPKPLDEGDAVAPPTTAADLGQMAEAVAREGDALAELSGRSWIWEETTPVAQIAEWFDDNGFQGLAEAIEDYGRTVSYPVGEFLLLLKKDLRTCETVHDDEPDPDVYAEARRQIELLRTTLTSTPAVMERARRLIRYATAMADSPKCRGPERDEALEAVRRAADAYEEARARIVRGQSWDALKTLRRIGERVSLSAAKAARSCAAGQTTLTSRRREEPVAAPTRDTGLERMPRKATESAYTYARRLITEASTRVGEGHHRVVRELLAEAGKQAATLSASKATRIYDRIAYVEGKLIEALTPEGWATFEVGDRVVFKGTHGQVSRVPAPDHGPTDKVTFLADGRKRGRRVEARLLERVDGPGEVVETEVDAEKDKALIDAFSAAISAAMQSSAA